MKKIATLIILSSLFSISCLGQITIIEKKAIIDSLMVELNDSSTILTKTENEIQSMIDLMKLSSEKEESLFPYQKFDSVIYSVYENQHKIKPQDRDKRKVIKSKLIEKNRANELLELINNPLNFQWGECGTPVTEAKLEFWSNGKVIATVEFACSHGQLFCKPENLMIRWGVLNERGNKLLDNIELWN